MVANSRMDGGVLVVERAVNADVDAAWAMVTESSRLAGWFGTWSGDPADGFVMVSMNAEPGEASPTRYDIVRCDAPGHLEVKANDAMGAWHLGIEIDSDDGRSVVRLSHFEPPLEMLADMAAGWEWYLDRLEASRAGTPVPDLDDFTAIYQPRERPGLTL